MLRVIGLVSALLLVLSAGPAQAAAYSPEGRFGLTQVSSGYFNAQGYAYDPDNDSVFVSVRIDVDGGHRVFYTSAYKWKSWNWKRSFSLPNGQYEICATAINRGAEAPDTLLGCKFVQVWP